MSLFGNDTGDTVCLMRWQSAAVMTVVAMFSCIICAPSSPHMCAIITLYVRHYHLICAASSPHMCCWAVEDPVQLCVWLCFRRFAVISLVICEEAACLFLIFIDAYMLNLIRGKL